MKSFRLIILSLCLAIPLSSSLAKGMVDISAKPASAKGMQDIVVNVAVKPTSAILPANVNFSVTWQITFAVNNADTIEIISQKGEFRAGGIGGKALGSIGAVITVPYQFQKGDGGKNLTLSTQESVTVPQSVLDAAKSQGVSSVAYVRSFVVSQPHSMLQGPEGFIMLNVSRIISKPSAGPQQATETRIDSVKAVPEIVKAPYAASFIASAVWEVIRINGADNKIVSSGEGVFFGESPDGPVLGKVMGKIAQQRELKGASSVFRFSENISIPARVTYTAMKSGFSRIIYVRPFTVCDGCAAMNGYLTINFAGADSSQFGMQNVSLMFDDRSISRMVAQGDKFTAYAELNHTGTGTLQGVWEVANPSSGVVEPIFFQIGTAWKHMTAAGRVRFVSPPLPTDIAGAHLVRFRIVNLALGFDMPYIRYEVGVPVSEKTSPPEPVLLIGPDDKSTLRPEEVFNWQKVGSAYAYILELYEAQDEMDESIEIVAPNGIIPVEISGPPITGMMLNAEKDKTALSPAVKSMLRGDTRYLWRIIAIDKNGKVIAESSIREILTP